MTGYCVQSTARDMLPQAPHSRCEKCDQPLALELITNGGFDTALRILA